MEILQGFWEQAVKLWNSMPPELQGIVVGIFMIAILIAILPRGYRSMQLVLPSGLQGKLTSTNNFNLENVPDEFTLNVNHEGIPEIPDTITIRVEHIGADRPDDDDDDEEVGTRDLTNEDLDKMLAISHVHLELLKKLRDADDTDQDDLLLRAVKDYANYLDTFWRTFVAR